VLQQQCTCALIVTSHPLRNPATADNITCCCYPQILLHFGEVNQKKAFPFHSVTSPGHWRLLITLWLLIGPLSLAYFSWGPSSCHWNIETIRDGPVNTSSDNIDSRDSLFLRHYCVLKSLSLYLLLCMGVRLIINPNDRRETECSRPRHWTECSDPRDRRLRKILWWGAP
jgi:hypothetical protein